MMFLTVEKMREQFDRPSWDVDYTYPKVEGEATIQAEALLVISIEIGVYRGLTAFKVGLGGGLGFDIAAGVEATQHFYHVSMTLVLI